MADIIHGNICGSNPHGPSPGLRSENWGAGTSHLETWKPPRLCFMALFVISTQHCCLDRPRLGTRHVTAPCRLHQTRSNNSVYGTGKAVVRNPKNAPRMAEAFHKVIPRHSAHLTSTMLQSCCIVSGHCQEHDSALWLLPKLTPYPLSVPPNSLW